LGNDYVSSAIDRDEIGTSPLFRNDGTGQTDGKWCYGNL